MSRILVLVVLAVLLFAAPLAADQALQNPDLQPNSTADAQNQTTIAETSIATTEVLPPLLLVVAVSVLLVGVRSLGGGF